MEKNIFSLERKEKVKLTDKTKKGIRLGIAIASSVLIFTVGILFITSCYSIYKSGPSPFTRASIAEAFSAIAVWVYITLSLVIVGAVVFFALPPEEKKLKGGRSPRVLVKKLSERVDIDTVDTRLKEKIEKERELRRVLSVGRIAISVLCAVLPLFYLLNPANFPAVSGEYNSEILRGMIVYLIFLAPLFIYEVIRVVLSDLSYNKEHALLKQAIAECGISPVKESLPTTRLGKAVKFLRENEKPIILGVRIAFVGCAIAFIAIGIANGGMADVLNKAIKICTECIGLG